MKKFLTVLLALSVVFTYSFSAVGTAFAADETKTLANRADALKMISDKYDEAKDTLDNALIAVKKTPASGIEKNIWAEVCDAAYDEVLQALNVQNADALQEFAAREKEVTGDIKGYDFGSTAPSPNDGYVYFKTALDEIDLTAITVTGWDAASKQFDSAAIATTEVVYDATMKVTVDLIKNYNIEQFVKDDKFDFENKTKSSYGWAVDAQTDALTYLAKFQKKGDGVNVVVPAAAGSTEEKTFAEATVLVEGVYKVNNAGTIGESYSGSFYEEKTGVHPALSALKTEATLTTDKAKIEYAKNKAVTMVKEAIEKERTAKIDAQEQIIFNESLKAKPNQKTIDAAKKAIEDANELFDAMAEIWTYRFDTLTFKVEADEVKPYYNNTTVSGIVTKTEEAIATFNNNSYQGSDIYADGTVAYDELKSVLAENEVKDLADHVAGLKEKAEDLKAQIGIDGSTKLAVDEALKDAIETTYMTGVKADLAVSTTNNVVHLNAHKLIGTTCPKQGLNAPSTKVTLDGKTYDVVTKWDTTGYSPNNEKAVKAIKEDAEAAIKAAKTVAEANAAFLDAYKAYDAVMTKADQSALFAYNGALYGKDAEAKAELEAYIDYKVALLKDAPKTTDLAANLKAYFKTNNLLSGYGEEVVDEASLRAAVAEVKAAVDGLKTDTVLKAEAKDIDKAFLAIKRPITLAEKDAVLALYDKIAAYNDYETMVKGSAPTLTTTSAKVNMDVEAIEDLEKAELDAMKDALGAVSKLTLADEEAVTAFEDAQTAYNDLFGKDGDYKDALTPAPTDDYDAADAYVAKIFTLKVEKAEKLIDRLPTYPTMAQLKEALDAVDALGDLAMCSIDASKLVKLDKFAQDAKRALITNVESLKIKVTTKRYDGKKMRINWTVSGDTSGIDGYRIYFSTKKTNSGYKYLAKTTKKYINHTSIKKNVKKGTRVFYRVRAYVEIDGQRYFSDYSTVGNRIWK